MPNKQVDLEINRFWLKQQDFLKEKIGYARRRMEFDKDIENLISELLKAKDAEWFRQCEKAIKENVERNIRAEGKRKDAKFKSVLEGLKYKRGKNEWATQEYIKWTNRINSKISKAIKEIER